nr:DUF748 domain-containing protein [uncultured Halomonas sp.]
MTSTRQGSSKRWWLIPLILIVVVGLLLIAWLWALPYYIEQRLETTFSSITGRETTIESVAIDNPFTLELTLENVRVAGQEQTPVLSSERITADVAWRSLWSPGWRLEKLGIQSPRLQLIWQEDANWNLVEMFAGGGSNKDNNQEPTPILIEHITAIDGRLDWINRRIDEPITLSFKQVSLDAKGYDNTSDAPFSLQSESRLNGADLSAKGKMGFSPWRVDVDMTAEKLPLTTLSGYLDKLVSAQTQGGTLATQARMQAGEATDAGVRISGDTDLRDVVMLEPNGEQQIARVTHVDIDGFLFELDRPRLEADRITLKEPWSKVVINEQMGTNLSAWTPPGAPNQKKPEQKDNGQKNKEQKDAKPKSSSSRRYALDELVIVKGAMAFADRHLSQPFEIDFSALEGKWKGLSSSQQDGGKLALKGQVSDGSPLNIQGAYDPLSDPWQGRFNMHFERMALATFAPYLRRFAGYEIEQGEVTLDLDYRLEDGRLDTDNQLMLRRIRLGEQVDDSATDLPVKTLIGVLRNDDGTIELEIPITIPLDKSGSIEFGDIAGQAIRKALQNLISSPIETLGEVIEGGSGDGSNGESDASESDNSRNENSHNGNESNEGQEREDGSNTGNRSAEDETQRDSQGLYRKLQTPS